jgi:hypothetical protein
MADLNAPPERKTLILTKGKDLVLDFIHKPGGAITDYPGGASVTLLIETDPETTVTGTVSGSSAVCRIESTEADAIPAGKPWRVIVSYATDPTTEDVPVVGKTKRVDS